MSTWRGEDQSPIGVVPSLPQTSMAHSLSAEIASPVTSPKATSSEGLSDKLVFIHLPFEQYSRLPVRPGESARDAISKLLRKRDITPQLCHVNVSADPRSEQIDLQEDLEKIVSRLDKNELWVHSEYLNTVKSIEHQMVRKTFIPPVTCDKCKGPIWFVGFRCEFCQVKFHQRCSSFAPLYCDLIQNVPRDEVLAQRLMKFASEMGGSNGEMAESVLSRLQPNSSPVHTPDSSQPDLLLKRGQCIKRHQGHHAPAKDVGGPLGPAGPYSRDRSSSVPNINSIKDEAVLEHNQRVLDALEAQRQADEPIHSGKIKGRSAFNSGQLINGRRLTNRLCPLPDISPFGSQSVSSTCSSPPNHPQSAAQLLPPALPLTPPQSAPPQKISPGFFRGRSRSPGERLEPQRTRVLTGQSDVEEWEIDPRSVTQICKVGSGSFGTVFKGTYFGAAAIKQLNVGEPTVQQLQAFKNEVALLRKTRHQNVLLFMGFVKPPNLAIVTQWCEGSSLYKHIHVIEPRVEFKMSVIVDILKQITLGMDYLHSKNIIHRDLKTNNIFLMDDMSTVKIGDFGLATVKTRWNGGQQNQQPTGSILWMAPEVIRMQDPNPYTTLSDVYAFGIVMYEMLSGSLPYSDINNRDRILFCVGRGYLVPNIELCRKDTPKLLLALYQGCIKFNRDERPEFREILDRLQSIPLPKLERSRSEPCLHHGPSGDDIGSARGNHNLWEYITE
ncbi:unnamed protein product [Auanema sp. JU1783]|nr:unnamed protein product [Auanema sp. JU1783]